MSIMQFTIIALLLSFASSIIFISLLESSRRWGSNALPSIIKSTWVSDPPAAREGRDYRPRERQINSGLAKYYKDRNDFMMSLRLLNPELSPETIDDLPF